MKTTDRVPAVDKHLGHLDALRGIAILGVLLIHVAMLTKQFGRTWIIGFTGQRGVQLFYMISAFTLCLSLDSERRESYPLSNYFIRRFFRIAPLFYVVIVANLVLEHVIPSYSALRNLPRRDVLLGFLFLNGVKPEAMTSVVFGGWSIAVETTFYLLLPLLHRYFNTVRRTLVLFVATAPVLGWGSRLLALRQVNPLHQQFFSFFWFPAEFPVFVLGMLAYCVWRDYIKGRVQTSEANRTLALLLIASSFMIYCGCLPFTDPQMYFSSFLFFPLILGLSIYSWPVLVNQFTRFLGKISFSLYLLHFFAMKIVGSLMVHIDRYPSHLTTRYINGHPWGMGLVYLMVLGISVPVCVLSWKFVEQPGIRLGRRWIARREGRRGSESQVPLVASLHSLEAVESTRDAQF